MKVLTADLGGGTADVTVHRVVSLSPLSLQEVTHARGDQWGRSVFSLCAQLARHSVFDSANIDRMFIQSIGQALGSDNYKGDVLLHSFETQHPVAFSQLLDSFETAKVGFQGNHPGGVRSVRLPVEFTDFIKRTRGVTVQQLLAASPQKEIIYRRGGLRISASAMQSFFDAVLDPLVNELRALQTAHNADFMFLVGGLGSSPVVKQRIRHEFDSVSTSVRSETTAVNDLRIIPHQVVTPPCADLAVVMGAVLFGLDSVRPRLVDAWGADRIL